MLSTVTSETLIDQRHRNLQVWHEYARWHASEGGGGAGTAASVLHKGRKVLHDRHTFNNDINGIKMYMH